MDVVDHATRSRMMSGIRGRNTKPEKLIRSMLHRQGFRFRLNVRSLPGTPDIVLPRYRTVILVHGCFWHGHECPLFRLPATRTEFWQKKIHGNRLNDQKVRANLISSGWRVGIVWECAVRGKGRNLEDVSRQISDWMRSSARLLEVRQ